MGWPIILIFMARKKGGSLIFFQFEGDPEKFSWEFFLHQVPPPYKCLWMVPYIHPSWIETRCNFADSIVNLLFHFFTVLSTDVNAEGFSRRQSKGTEPWTLAMPLTVRVAIRDMTATANVNSPMHVGMHDVTRVCLPQRPVRYVWKLVSKAYDIQIYTFEYKLLVLGSGYC